MEISGQKNGFSEINVVWIPEEKQLRFFYKEEMVENVENINDIKEVKLNENKKKDLAEKDISIIDRVLILSRYICYKD